MPNVTLRVLCGEYVVSYGARETRWWVHQDGRWKRIDSVPNVVSERVSAGPGTVWHTLFELLVPAGTWVMRVDSEPMPERITDPLRYLEKERRASRRRVTRRFYRVQPSGELELAKRELAPE
jgi:hypothetical protein